MTNRELKINDAGPIEELVLPIPEAGGLVVLHGANGVGKTTALQCAEGLLGGTIRDVSVRDGQKRVTVKGLGVTLTLARSTRRTGELEVETLQARADIGDLIHPGLLDKGAADAKRIKTLIRLRGSRLNLAELHKLIGGEIAFKEIVSPAALETKDPIELAAKVKREFERAARTEAAKAETEKRQAEAWKQSTADIDLNSPHDEDELREVYTSAVQAMAQQEANLKSGLGRCRNVRNSQQELAEAEKQYTGPHLTAAKERAQEAREIEKGFGDDLKAAQEAVERLKRRQEQAYIERTHREDVLKVAEAHEASLRRWRNIVAAGAPDEAALNDLREKYAAAVKQLDEVAKQDSQGAIIRKALQQKDEAMQAEQRSQRHQDRSDALREAARSVDGVLSDLVACPNLLVREGRIYTQTPRGDTLFDELSDGERTKLVVDLAVQAVGTGGLVPISQESFQAMDQENRELLARELRAAGVVGLTALADEGELRVEVIGE